MWTLEYGPEWSSSWAAVSLNLSSPDRVLGAMEFALGRGPMTLTKGLTGGRDTKRVLDVVDPISGRMVTFGVRVSPMTHLVVVEWVEIV